MVEPVVYPCDTYIQDTGDDWDNGIIPESASLGPMPMPVWLMAHRELHNSPRMRLVFGALAGSLGEQRLRPSVVAQSAYCRSTSRASDMRSISSGPSVIIIDRMSRQSFSIGRSVVSPMPPKI